MGDDDQVPASTVDVVNRLRRLLATERRRIARDLHDQVAHPLSIALYSMELHEIYLQDDPSRAREQLRSAVHAVLGSLETVRRLSSDLRDREIEGGIEPALAEYLETVTPPGVRWAVSVTGDEAALPGAIRNELYLILREAARNSLIHSSPRRVDIFVWVGADEVRATVSDDGHGFDVERPGTAFGLASMRERAQLLGGGLTVSSTPGAGTAVDVNVPLTGTSEEQ